MGPRSFTAGPPTRMNTAQYPDIGGTFAVACQTNAIARFLAAPTKGSDHHLALAAFGLVAARWPCQRRRIGAINARESISRRVCRQRSGRTPGMSHGRGEAAKHGTSRQVLLQRRWFSQQSSAAATCLMRKGLHAVLVSSLFPPCSDRRFSAGVAGCFEPGFRHPHGSGGWNDRAGYIREGAVAS